MGEILANIIIIAVLALIVFGIVFYLYRAKKRGETCVGCPYAKQCAERKCCEKNKT